MGAQFEQSLDILLFLARIGIYASAGIKILDFGCGGGELVQRFRDLGFEAYGFDIHDRVNYRSEEERDWFRFSQPLNSDTSDTMFDADVYRIPFDDDTFDVIHSSSVIEHVMDLDPIMRECARVMSRNGIVLHRYPAMRVIVEPHTYIPLGGIIHTTWWLKLWALLGVRNPFQEGFSVEQVMESNTRYYRSGLRYYSRNELCAVATRYFDDIQFPPRRIVHAGDTAWLELRNVVNALRQPRRLAGLALTTRLSVIVCQGKRVASGG